jgi:hypothetical protein
MANLIRVLNGANLLSTTDINGLLIQDAGGRQQITLDSNLLSTTFDPGNPASFSFTPQPSSGWDRMTFSSGDGIGFARDTGGFIRGNLTSCILESSAIIPPAFASGAGNHLPISYQLQLTAYPVHARINATVWEGVIPRDDTAFRKALAETSRDFTSILDTAYTLDFVSENLTGIQGATLNLSLASSWVQKFGGGNNITVVRLGNDLVNQTLNPAATSTDATNSLDFFIVPSSRGLSRFALVSATGSSNLIQIGARVATQFIQSSGPKDRTPWVQPTPPVNATPRPVVTYYGEGRVDTTPAGIARDSVIIKAADWGASLAIGAGTVALDSAGRPLTMVTARAVQGGLLPRLPGDPGIRFTGMAYDMGPDGATFDPPVTLSFTVPGDRWAPDARYSIRTYSTQAGSWDDVPASVDPANRIISGRVSHLCIFGLFTVVAAGPTAQAQALATPRAEPGAAPRTPLGIFTGMVGWIYAAASAHLLLSLAAGFTVLAALAASIRRAWLSRNRTWITLYLASLTGLLWASFLFTIDGPFWEVSFILITVGGLNLIVHALRFDRIDLTRRAPPRFAMAARRW